MKTQNFNELTQTLQSLIIASENESMFKLDVKFHPDGETVSGSQCKTISKIERYNLKTSGYFNVVFFNLLNGSNFTMGHVFRLNFEIIKNKLKDNREYGYFPFEELDTIEVKNSIAKQIEINYNEFKINLACYNGKLDNYDGIAKFIIKHNAEIMFRINPHFKFGEYLSEDKKDCAYSLNYKLEWCEDYCVRNGLQSLNHYLLGELKKVYDLDKNWFYNTEDRHEFAYYSKISGFQKAMLNLFLNSNLIENSNRYFEGHLLTFNAKLDDAYNLESQIQKSFWFNKINPKLFLNKGYEPIVSEINKCFKRVFKFNRYTNIEDLLLKEICVNLKYLQDDSSIYSFLLSVFKHLSYIKKIDENFESNLKEVAKKIDFIRKNCDQTKFIVPENDTIKLDKEFDLKMDEFLVEIGVWRSLEEDDRDLGDREWDIEMRQILWRARYVNSVIDFYQLYECIWFVWTSYKFAGRNRKLMYKNLEEWKKRVPPIL